MPKRLIILGAAESGVGAAILAKRHGYDVFVSDGGSIKEIYKKELRDHAIEFEEARHTVATILEADEIMKSPGIPEKSELVKSIREKGIPVISEIELAYRFKGTSKIVAITGSNGKTTTTSLIYHLCKESGLDCALVGNIGNSFAKQIAEDPKPLYIAEISSFQLDDIMQFRPDIAVLTNITEDHLDRYDYDFQKYINSKFRIVENQTNADFFIFCMDDEVTMRNIEKFNIHSNLLPITMKNSEILKGAFIRNEALTVKTDTENFSMSIYDFTLQGKHNQYNTMAAGVAASTLGIRKDNIRDAVKTAKSLEHRMEYVATVRGVDFINDSKATNVNSLWFALESMEKPVILILGGVDKGNDYDQIMGLVKEKVKAIVCMGTDNTKIHEAFGSEMQLIVNTSSAKDAVHAAFHFANKGDVVLLSPACASFDLFKNYEDRGRQFKEAVKEL